MAVIINDTCINCGACIDECPVEAILDDSENPTGEEIYYVQEDKCVECVGYYDEPACIAVCPVDCIISNPNHVETTQELKLKLKIKFLNLILPLNISQLEQVSGFICQNRLLKILCAVH